MKEKILQHKLDENLKKFAGNIAVEYGSRCLTYLELDGRACRIADWIIQKGVRQQSFVGIMADDRVEFISALLALLKMRIVFVPLDTTNPDHRLEKMVDVTNIDIILADKESYRKYCEKPFIKRRNIQLQVIEEIVEKGESGDRGEIDKFHQIAAKTEYLPQDKAYVYFTSGTTGEPRAVVGKNTSLLQYCQWEVDMLPVDEGFRLSQFSNIGFDAFLKEMFTAFLAGATLCIPENMPEILNSEDLIHWVEKSKISLLHCVPSVFRLMNVETLNENNFSELKFILLSGEEIFPTELKNWYDKIDERIQLVNLYGTTETTILKSYYFIGKSDTDRPSIPIGKPIKGCRLVILDEQMNICSEGITGEIYIRTPYHTHGYFNAPQLNREKFLPNPFSNKPGELLFKTGDRGRFLLDGNVEFLGRIDRQVKVLGIRIELEEIEHLLNTHPLVKQGVVLKHEQDENEFLIAYVTCKENSGENEASGSDVGSDIIRYATETLPAYMVPAKIVVIDEFPRKPNGKIDYHALEAFDDETVDYIAPRDDIEEKLVELWSRVLKQEENMVGVREGFFDLGGNSLNLMILIAMIHKEFDVRISLGDIFQHPTIEDQAEIIRKTRKEKHDFIDPVEKKEYYRLSSAQKRMYIINQMEAENISYNQVSFARLSGSLEQMALVNSVRKLIKRHETLRTAFLMLEGSPVQRVFDAEKIEFSIEDYSPGDSQGETGTEEGVREYIGKIVTDFDRPFDLSVAPMLRLGLVKIQEEDHIIMVNMHHIITDAVSTGIFLDELAKLYLGEELPSLRVQYKDYSEWQNNFFKSDAMRKQETYWLKRFEGTVNLLDMPLDYPRPPVQSFAGAALVFELDEDMTRRVKELTERMDVTVFMVLLAAYTILLALYTGKNDILVGSPIAGRFHTDIQNLIGMFVNMLVHRNFPTRDKTFREFLAEVKENALNAFDNKDYQFDQLVSKLQLERTSDRNMLIEAVFTLQNASYSEKNGSEEELSRMNIKVYKREVNTTKFDLTLEGTEKENTIDMFFTYSTALFKKSTIEKMKRYYIEILEQVAENIDIKIGDISVSLDKQVVVSTSDSDDELDFML